jgi:peptidoglycan/LPS O-acetylase OafA/YrhL
MGENRYGAFDGLRLIAAASVLFSHCYAIVNKDANEPIVRLTGGTLTLGELAVYTFFAMSGYLVTQSWTNDPSAIRFMTRRVLRIVPALAFVIIISFAVIGPVTTQLTPSNYFSSSQAWTYLDKILIYPAQYGLPGVFEHNPLPIVVNGSLWTLRVEFGLYITVAAFGYFSLLQSRQINITCAAACIIASGILTQTSLLANIPFLHQITALFLNAAPFFIGAALAQSKLLWKPMFGAAVLLVVATIFLISTPAAVLLVIAAIPFVTIFVARYGRCDLRRIGDYSYGTYLFAFPMQQTVVYFLPGVQPLGLFVIAGIGTFICAFISWHVVEKRALVLKPRRKQTATALLAPT